MRSWTSHFEFNAWFMSQLDYSVPELGLMILYGHAFEVCFCVTSLRQLYLHHICCRQSIHTDFVLQLVRIDFAQYLLHVVWNIKHAHTVVCFDNISQYVFILAAEKIQVLFFRLRFVQIVVSVVQMWSYYKSRSLRECGTFFILFWVMFLLQNAFGFEVRTPCNYEWSKFSCFSFSVLYLFSNECSGRFSVCTKGLLQ